MSDGERTVVDQAVWKGIQLDETTPIIVLLHGLSGSSDSNYIRHAIVSFTRNFTKQFRILIMHARGAAKALERVTDDQENVDKEDFLLRKPMFYCAAFTNDLHETGKLLQEEFPKAPKIVIGYSLGANVTTHYLAEVESPSPFIGGAGVCNPYDLNIVNQERMKSYPGKLYSSVLVKGLKGFLQRNYKVFRENSDFDIDAALAVNTVHEFDKTVVVPIHKYNNVEHYYQQGSSARQAHAIRVPFLSIAAADDPLIPLSVRPVERCASQTMYVSTERGGHVAHLMNGSLTGASWFDNVLCEYVDALLEFNSLQQK